tara:strand:- start:7414 stop:8031 length:618 start_codon:yes stop_codon:yes gene_type:complete
MEKKISPNELPFTQFKEIGMTKEDVLNMSKSNLQKLLKGEKTEIVNVNPSDLLKTPIEVKLRLERQTDNTVRLFIHPSRNTIFNEYNLNKEQLEQLKKGELVQGVIKAKNGEMRPHIFQLDHQINEIMNVVKGGIKIPEIINGVKVSSEQNEQIASGKLVGIKGKDGITYVQLDLNNSRGIRIDSPLGYERNGKLDLATKNDLKM